MALLETNFPHVREFWSTGAEALNVELVLHEIEVDSVLDSRIAPVGVVAVLTRALLLQVW